MVIFEIIDQFHKKIKLTKERRDHIYEHPEMGAGELQKIKEVVLIPDIIKQSKHDKKVLLYYKFYEKTPVAQKYLVVIIKIFNQHGFVITAYYTDKLKEGKTIWQR